MHNKYPFKVINGGLSQVAKRSARPSYSIVRGFDNVDTLSFQKPTYTHPNTSDNNQQLQGNFTGAISKQPSKAPSIYYSEHHFLSDALENFNSAWQDNNDRYFLAAEDTNGNAIYTSYKGHENILQKTKEFLGLNNNLRLTLALDTSMKFEDQIPEPAFIGITSWKQLNTSPIVTITELQQYFRNHLTTGHLERLYGTAQMPAPSRGRQDYPWQDPKSS